MAAPIITLTTDFGTDDGFPAAMKAEILRRAPGAVIVDITHDVPPGDIARASFILGSVAGKFPEGTVHCAVVDPGVGTDRPAVALQTPDGETFVGPDNGIFTHAIGGQRPLAGASHERPFLAPYTGDVPSGAAAHIVTPGAIGTRGMSRTFHGRDLFAPAAALLASGQSPEMMGPVLRELNFLNLPGPRRGGGQIAGHVQYIDHFGNVATDIPADMLEDSDFSMKAGSSLISGLSESYSAAGGPGCVIASHGFLEIFVTGGDAATELGLRLGDGVLLTP